LQLTDYQALLYFIKGKGKRKLSHSSILERPVLLHQCFIPTVETVGYVLQRRAHERQPAAGNPRQGLHLPQAGHGRNTPRGPVYILAQRRAAAGLHEQVYP